MEEEERVPIAARIPKSLKLRLRRFALQRALDGGGQARTDVQGIITAALDAYLPKGDVEPAPRHAAAGSKSKATPRPKR